MLNIRHTAGKLATSHLNQSTTTTVAVVAAANATAGHRHQQHKPRHIDTTSIYEQQMLLARSLHILYARRQQQAQQQHNNNNNATSTSGHGSKRDRQQQRRLQQQQQQQQQQRAYATDESGFDDDFKATKRDPSQDQTENMMKRIDFDVKNNPIVLYMKGNPLRPQCGFSRAVVDVLSRYGYRFISFDMNADILMKETLKKYSDWPTIPQLYVHGEFVGGCDIVINLHRENKLAELLEQSGAEKVATD